MAHSFLNPSFEYGDGLGPSLTSVIVAPFLLLDGDELRLNVSGTSVILSFMAADGVSAAAAVAAITGQSPLITADVVSDVAGDHVRVTSAITGETSELEVLGGRAQSAMAFPTGIVNGVTHPGPPWGWTVAATTAVWQAMEFSEDTSPDIEKYNYTELTAEFDRSLFIDDGLQSQTEDYNEHQPGFINRKGLGNPTVPVLFTGPTATETYLETIPAPAFAPQSFTQGATEDYSGDFAAPAPAFTAQTFAGDLLETTEQYDRLQPGTHMVSALNTTLTMTITVDTVDVDVTAAEVAATGVPPLEEDKAAAEIFRAKIEGASDTLGLGVVIDTNDLSDVRLYLYPLDRADTPSISGANLTVTNLPVFSELTHVWHFKDSYPLLTPQI